MASVVLIGSENVLCSLVMSVEEKYNGDTGPDHDADECGIMGKTQDDDVYTETRCGADPLAVIVGVIACGLWTTDFDWNVDII
ncbi:hypothetical protein STEG23_027715 [Scotinomys teguina]